MEQVATVQLASNPMAFYISQQAIPQKVRDGLQTIAAKRKAIDDADRKVVARTADRDEILSDEANLRENIKVLPAGSASLDTKVRELTAKDADLDAANKDLKALRASADAARDDLASYLESATME